MASDESIKSIPDISTRYSLALADLNNDPSVSLREIARIYDLPRSTLQARRNGRQSAKTFQTGRQRLSVHEENALIRWIDTITAWGWPPRIGQLETMAKHLMTAKGDLDPLGQHWYKNFLRRHPEFKTRYSRNLNQDRKDAGNHETIQKWFDLYNSTRMEHGILESDIYNMDEKGFAMDITDSSKVLVRRTEAQAFSVHAGNQDWISLIECVSSNGTTLPPYFIFKGKQIQQAWLDPIKDGQAVLQVSDNGWTTNAIGLQWLKAFDLHTKTQTQGTHRLLVLDGHESHVSSDFIQYCCDHSIVALCLPPHSTHLLQPLDVGVFGPLSKAYKKCVHLHSRYGAVNVNKLDFLRYYQEARSTAITTHNILSAWRGAGLIPFNPSVIISRLPRPKTPPYTSFTNSNGVQVDIAVTPSTATRINQFVNEILAGMTPSLHTHVLGLKDTALTAVADRTVLQRTNQELLDKQKQQRKKQSRKGVGNARVLTVDKGRALIQEAEDRVKELANKTARYHALRGKVGFAKLVWKEMPMDDSVFM